MNRRFTFYLGPSAPAGARPGSIVGRILRALLGLVLAVAGVLFMIGALLLGLLVAAGVVVWALLRGRRPGPVNLRWRGMSMPGRGRAPATGEVVDIEAREVPDRHP